MKLTPNEALKQYFGYDSFRPLQEDIISSVLNGRDTLALLPTGGGKSICFQIPALCMDGLCLVVTPLVALMIDQVENLKKRGISAYAVHSGMHAREVRITYEKCMDGQVKFLYLSPERLVTTAFKDITPYLKPCLIAVDEAHCISQWGYDFRPPYLKIAETRHLFPGTPVLALTATAVSKVVADIQDKLLFTSNNVFRKSFRRENLAYMVLETEDKYGKLLRMCSKVKGSGIIYVRNRRLTRETAEFLNRNGIRAGFYHAGLEPLVRSARQKEWMEGKTRVIVATNAFGMGIDKPDVRFVVHLDLPDTLEAYFQEAGRAGRDERKSFATIFFNQGDIIDARHNLDTTWPDPDVIRQVYQALGNYFQLAVGSGKEMSFDFDLEKFASSYRLKPLNVFSALKILERDGYLALNDALNSPSRALFLVNKEMLYKYQVENMESDRLIKVLLRSYSGLFSDFTIINEYELARRLSLNAEEVVSRLVQLKKDGIVEYIPRKSTPQLVFTSERVAPQDIELSNTYYFERKKDARIKLEELISYVKLDQGCRSIRLQDYFGDQGSSRCGICDLCLARKKPHPGSDEFESICSLIRDKLAVGPMTLHTLLKHIPEYPETNVINAVRWMTDNRQVLQDNDMVCLPE